MYKEEFRDENDLYLNIEHINNLNPNAVFGITKKQNMSFVSGDEIKETLQNRKDLAISLKKNLPDFVVAYQSHSDIIIKVNDSFKGMGTTADKKGPECDAMYTNSKNIALATFHADCTPVYIYVPSKDIIGICHAGWTGTVKAIVYKFISHLIENENVNPSEIIIYIGPSISMNAMEVEYDVISKLKTECSDYDPESCFVELSNGKYKFDVKKQNWNQAIAAGVDPINIHVSTYCTYCDKDLFLSYRRGDDRRMWGFVSQ